MLDYEHFFIKHDDFKIIEGRVTHYLKFSVKITTNHLHRHFIKQAPYLKKGVSRMVLKKIM